MRFSYVGYTLQRGIVKGLVDANTEREARTLVQEEGLKVLRVKPALKIPSAEQMFPSLYKVGAGELIRFCHQMATMLASGGNLLRVLDMLEHETKNRVMRKTLTSIRRTLDEGGSLSEALAKHPRVFDGLFVSVVEVGEFTGRIGPSLEQLADIIEKDKEAKSRAIRTLMYPMAIIGLSAVTLLILMMVAMPPLLDVFDQLGADLPLMTRMVVAGVGFLSTNYQQIGIGLVIAVVAFVLARRNPKAKRRLDSLMIRAPVLGAFLVSAELSRFARTIAMLLEAGITLANAIHLAVTGLKNSELREAFMEAEESLLTGHGLTETLRRYTIIPSMFIELTLLGEESNSLQRTMNDAAEAYQKQLEQRLNSLLGMLEPVSTVVVGGIVGIIAFSMFVPIYSGLNAVR
ncbi:MAG: type II secretion system F family protein [Chloroflexi bacterium]|nr:type II secretion system F family protein [Chloroflexota bacterium]